MEPDTASTAQSAAPSAEAGTPTVDNYGFPLAGDLSTDDMSDAELDAFVDQTLGIKPGGKPSEPSTTPTTTTPATDVVAPVAEPPETPKPAAPAEEEAPQPAAELAEIPALDTSDLWLEITNTDGEKVRLTFDEGIPDDLQFTSDKQLFEVLDAFNEMKQLKADRETTITKATEAKAAAETATQSEAAIMAGWSNEIQDLIDAGLIDKAKAAPADGKQYTLAEVAADPGLKLTNDVFDFMKAENSKRATTGKPPIGSFAAAFTLFNKQSTSVADAQAAKDKAALIKQRGAMVGGSSAPTGGDRGYTYKRGSARNVWQVDTSDI